MSLWPLLVHVYMDKVGSVVVTNRMIQQQALMVARKMPAALMLIHFYEQDMAAPVAESKRMDLYRLAVHQAAQSRRLHHKLQLMISLRGKVDFVAVPNLIQIQFLAALKVVQFVFAVAPLQELIYLGMAADISDTKN